MKKLVKGLLAVLMMVSVVGCSSGNEKTDSDAIKEKGKLVVGITDFAPMDYKDENGNWIGFDADLATLFAKSLGVEVEFSEIEWDNKAIELQSNNIDCVWNGMTLNDEVKSTMDCSNAYMNNAQVVIVNKKNADKAKSVEDIKGFKFAVEAGSAGKDMVEENGLSYTEFDSQAKTLVEIRNGSCDAAIIDSLMAAAMVGEGTSFDDLTYTIGLNKEEYGVGFRQGSNLVEKLNAFLVDSYKDGTIQKLADQYGVSAAIVEQK